MNRQGALHGTRPLSRHARGALAHGEGLALDHAGELFDFVFGERSEGWLDAFFHKVER